MNCNAVYSQSINIVFVFPEIFAVSRKETHVSGVMNLNKRCYQVNCITIYYDEATI